MKPIKCMTVILLLDPWVNMGVFEEVGKTFCVVVFRLDSCLLSIYSLSLMGNYGCFTMPFFLFVQFKLSLRFVVVTNNIGIIHHKNKPLYRLWRLRYGQNNQSKAHTQSGFA